MYETLKEGPRADVIGRYQLAEKLSSRLDEMGKDLSSMVEEINDASSSLNKNSKPDDPVSVSREQSIGIAVLLTPAAAFASCTGSQQPLNSITAD